MFYLINRVKNSCKYLFKVLFFQMGTYSSVFVLIKEPNLIASYVTFLIIVGLKSHK